MTVYTKYFDFLAAYNEPGSTQYQFENVVTTDTVRCYFDCAAGETWFLSGNETNCSSTPTSGADNTYADVTFSSVGSYSVTWRSLVFEVDGFLFYANCNLSGTVSTSTPVDDIPDAPNLGFGVAPVPLNTWIVNANTQTITSIDAGISFSATTDQQGQLSTGPAFTNWATSQTVSLGSTLKVRILSAITPITYTYTVLRYLAPGGTVSDDWNVRTGYPPDSEVSPSSSTIGPWATSATTIVSDVTSPEYYAVRLNNGSTNIVFGQASSTQISLTFTTSLPAVGATTTYEIFSMRSSTNSGDNIYYPTDDTFTVTRANYSLPDTTVSASSSTITGTATSAFTYVTGVTSGEEYAVRLNNGSTNLVVGTASGTALTLTFTSNLPANGATTTYEIFSRKPVSQDGDGVTWYATNDTFTVYREYNPADTIVSASSSTITGTATSASTTVTGVTSGEDYAVRLNNGSTNLVVGTASGTSIVLTFTSSLPANGATTTYEIFSRKPVSQGGDGVTWYATNDTFTVTRSYILPDTAVTPSSNTIGAFATSAFTYVTGVTSGEEYAVRLNNGSTNLVVGTASGTAITLTFTSNLPAPGSSTTYEIFSRRPTSLGGDGVTWYATNDTFTITRTAYDTTPDTPDIGPDLVAQELDTLLTSSVWTITGMDPSPASTTASVTAGELSVNAGAWVTSATVYNGNTIQVRLTSASTYDTIVTTTLSVGGVSDDWLITTKVDDTLPPPDPITPPPGSNYGLQIFSSSGAIRLDTTDRLARIYSTHTGTINSGSTVVISVPGYNPSDPTFGLDWYPMGSQYSISPITNQISITRVADGGASSTYVLKIFRI